MEITRQIHTFVEKTAWLTTAADLIVHAAGVCAVPDGQSVGIGIVGKPAIEELRKLVIISGAQPFVIIATLFRAKNGKLSEERLEWLAQSERLCAKRALNEAVWFLQRDERPEIIEAEIRNAVVAQVQIFEIQIPIIKLMIDVTRFQGLRIVAYGQDAVVDDVLIDA